VKPAAAQTAVTEVVYHLDKDLGTGFDSGETMKFSLVQCSATLTGEILCFSTATRDVKVTLTGGDYSETNRFAKNVRDRKLPALRAPSARRRNAMCVPIFDKSAVRLSDSAYKFSVEMKRGSRSFVSLHQTQFEILEIANVVSEL
jgi:RES domain